MSGHAALSVDGPDGWAIWMTDDADLCVDPGVCPSVTLDIGRHIECMLLERVRAGAITEFSGQYFDNGQRISWHTIDLGFEALIETGYLLLILRPDSGARSAED